MGWQENYNEASKGLRFLRHEGGASVYEAKRMDLTNGSFVTERRVTTEAYYERVVWVSKWEEKSRYECFCCTCTGDPYNEQIDPACRNHGYGGRRPCDIHNLPGSEWEDTDEMPESVLTIREKQKS